MICTTNCSWALTLKMVTGLVENLGRESDDGRESFPNAEAMAAMPLKFFVDEVRAGYRAPYLKELADRVASGELNVEEWLTSELADARTDEADERRERRRRLCRGEPVEAAGTLRRAGARLVDASEDFFKSETTAGKQTTRRSRATTRDSTSGAASRSGATSRAIGYSHKEAQEHVCKMQQELILTPCTLCSCSSD